MKLPGLKGLWDSVFGTGTQGRPPVTPATGFATPIESLFGGVPIHMYANFEHYLQVGSSKVWAAWKAADICAKAVVTTPHQILRKGSTDVIKVPDLERLMEWPNEFESWRDHLYRTLLHYRLCGMAFWYKSEATLKGDRPKELYCLNPKRIRILPDTHLGIAGFIYTVNGIQIPMDVQEVVMFRRPNPDQDFWGLGDIEAGKGLFKEFVARQNEKDNFYENGARPSGILINASEAYHDQEEEWVKAKAKWNQEYGGKKNAGKLAWLSGNWKFERLAYTNRELQDMEQRQQNIDDIFTQFGVPLSVAGRKDAANYATAMVDRQRFREFTVLPDVLMLQDTINTDLVRGFNPNALIQYNVSGLIDVGKVMTDLAPLFDRGGMTINEMRAAAGYPKDEENPNWEESYVLNTYTPLALAGIMPDPNTVTNTADNVVALADAPPKQPGGNGSLDGEITDGEEDNAGGPALPKDRPKPRVTG